MNLTTTTPESLYTRVIDSYPFHPDLRQLSLKALCTNRDLPLQMCVGKGRSDLTVESGAEVTADVSVTLLTVRGTFTGSVVASEGVRLEAGSRVVGDIRTPQLTIADGAAYRGNIDMDVTLPASAGGRAGA
jgi:hypothetical protein